MTIIKFKIGQHTTEKHYIECDEPHQKSYASYLMLVDYYRKLDVDYLTEYEKLEKYFKFREEFLTNELQSKGYLECAYCHRKDLIIGYTTIKDSILNNSIKNLATIDHVIPISKGGKIYDVNNCVVSCKKCNNKKADKILTDTNKQIKTYDTINCA
jgi:5-methylcytosine-specific restriction endonuclease McrA